MSILVPIEEMQRNAGRYLLLAEDGKTILITRNETVVAKLVGVRAAEERAERVAIAKSLFGILPNDASLEEARKGRLSRI